MNDVREKPPTDCGAAADPTAGDDRPWLDFLNSVGEPAGLLNSRREFVAANDKLLALLGLSRGELQGLRIGQSVNCMNVRDGPAGCGSGEKCRECGANIAILQGQASRAGKEVCRWRLPVGCEECFVDVSIWTFPLEGQPHWTFVLIPEDTSEERRLNVAETVGRVGSGV